MSRSKRHILIISTCFIDWGGSEELWACSIPYLQAEGFEIIVYKKNINSSFHRFSDMANHGVALKDYRSSLSLPSRVINKLVGMAKKAYAESKDLAAEKTPDLGLEKILEHFRPEMVLISQGINFDGLLYAHQCLIREIPYVIVSQKAVDFYWPDKKDRSFMIEAYQKAKKNFFVSRHNQRLTEEQLGTRLPNSEVIFNPVKTSRRVVPYPSTENGFRLACIARLFLLDKGQDILIRILAKDKWKRRPLHITFVGSGDDREPLLEMAKLLNVTNIDFAGQSNNIESIWHDHHALILSSRSEGLPMAMVEAMSNGRTVIVTNAGGIAELVEDGVTGFLGNIDQDQFESTMERAWNQRHEWENMGHAAAKFIQEKVPAKPEFDFSNQLKTLIND
ncbi:MAG: group 1 glycosyl transferase [Bacteroidetes bacterium]|nr:MAG: group 1 glycosyl transferase [Bacteroidota bacterium]